ncbi:MAG: hypothetical protein WCB15_06230 [Desulfobacterales bacterium]
MGTKSYSANRFSGGFIAGALGALLLGVVLLYVLNMSEVLAISVLDVPSVQRVLSWAYENLRLSVVPFFLTLIFYTGAMWRLKHYLRDQGASVEKIAQADHLVDIWINLFFGIGVIWTAIGMRGALLEGLGNLNAHSAAKLGAFSILQRLVDGGILLALSTTIVGAIGGYLLRLIKSLAVGTQVRIYYSRVAKQQADAVNVVLESIDEQLNQLVSCAERQPPKQR